jgi:hypothetical protein
MPETRLTVEVDGDQLSDDDLRELGEIQAEEAADKADAAVLTAGLSAASDGSWTCVLDPLAAPETPIAVELSHGDASYRFDGLSAEAAWTVDPEGPSQMTIKAQDRTLELDREEKVTVWSGTSDSAIAESIFGNYGMSAEVESTPDAPDPDVHVVLQRGSDLGFLRALARKWGYALWVENAEGRVTGHFAPLDPLADPQGELSLAFGGDAQRVQVDARLVEGRRVKASRIPPLSDTEQTGDAPGDDQAQGSAPLGGVATALLAPSDVEGEVDPSSTAEGLARTGAFGVTLTAEIDTARVGLLVRARRTILVAGLGDQLSGRYLVQRVRHVVALERHVQHLTLVRNALGLSGDEPFGGGGLGGLL